MSQTENYLSIKPNIGNVWSSLLNIKFWFVLDGTNGYASLRYIGCFPGNHLDAVYDWTDAEAQSAACTAVLHKRKVGILIKCYGLHGRKWVLVELSSLKRAEGKR